MADCELTHLSRVPIDVDRAAVQHGEYERALARLGAEVVPVPAAPAHADSVFVEDTAVVVREIAVIARPGAASRRGETSAVAEVLRGFRPLALIDAPGTLDGGDVLRLGRVLYVGLSGRTNMEGAAQLRGHLAPFGYEVRTVAPTGCLHLKTAVTAIGDDAVVLNAAWIDPATFAHYQVVQVDPREPFAANVVRVHDALLMADAFPRTRERLEARGARVAVVDASELAKAEGAVTCCSILLEA
jgi:dimethylargininase